jgi:hypothetical protein
MQSLRVKKTLYATMQLLNHCLKKIMQETNVYTTTILPMMRTLEALSKIIDKGIAFAATKKTERMDFTEALLNDRLIFDQHPFVRQVQIACDMGKGAAARLSKQEPPSMPDTEKTAAELQARIQKTLDFMKTVSPESVIGNEDAIITMPPYYKKQYGGEKLTGYEYATMYALPNFYFHVTTAYAILRKNGVQLGKSDYLGPLPLK